MKLDIINIVNNKLHNFKYLNFTIAFYVIIFYTYYRLFMYLIDKNYIMLLLYFIFFILVYSFYKNFTYFIGFVILIIFRVFNIDNMINNNILIEGNDFSSLMNDIKAEANKKGDKLENDSKNKKPPPNPCKSYIIDKVQQAGINIANTSFNEAAKQGSAQDELNQLLTGHKDLVAPRIYRLG